MFGVKKPGVGAYAQVGLETGVVAASPVKLTVMLYEGAISACINAMNAMDKADYAAKSANLSKAMMIIDSGLRLSLDKKAGGAIAESLDALYIYMSKMLLQANKDLKREKVQEVTVLLIDLKSAWEAIDPASANQQVQNATLNQYVQAKTQQVGQRVAAYDLMGAGA